MKVVIKKMIDDALKIAADEQKRKLVGNIRKLSLNLVEKWRKIREAEKYAWKFYKPKLIAR